MKLFAIFTSIITAAMINQLLSYGLFKQPKVDNSSITSCQLIEITPIDIQQYQTQMLYLTEDGIYNELSQQLYSQTNSKALYSDDDYIYLCFDNKIDILKDWKVFQTVSLPENLIVYDFIVIDQELLLTIDYNLSDLLGIYLKTQSFALLKCSLTGNCEFLYDITGIHLSGIEYIDHKIVVMDTFGKKIFIFDEMKYLLDSIDLEDGPRRLVKYNQKLYFTAIPKILELLTLPKFTCLYELNNGMLQKIAVFENFYYTGVKTIDRVLMGNSICQLSNK